MRKHPLAICEKCPLVGAKCIPTKGPANAELALVSRSPGYYDTSEGGPFSGPSSKVVDYMLTKNGVQRRDVLLTNVVLCETDAPSNRAIAACRPRLEDEIKGVATVIAAGAEATRALTKYTSVNAARGFAHYRDDSGGNRQRVIVTNNPALVLRDNDVFPDLVTDFKIAIDPLPEPEFPDVRIITDEPDALNYVRELRGLKDNKPIACDLEWDGTHIECIGFSRDGRRSVVLGANAVERRSVTDSLRELFNKENFFPIWHNGKSDTTTLRHNQIAGRISHDTFLLSRLLDEEPGRHSLEYLLQVNFGWPDYEPPSVKHYKTTGSLDYYGVLPNDIERARKELYVYNGYDVGGTYQLFQKFSKMVKAEGLWDTYVKYMLPVIEGIRDVEMRGFFFDPEEACNIREREVIPRLRQWTKQMREMTGYDLLNPNSNKQMASVYYDHFGVTHTLKDSGKRKFSRSTGKELRKEIAEGRFAAFHGQRDLVQVVAQIHGRFSKVDTQRGTYLEGLTLRATEEGKLHCTFMVPGTITGRATSKNPNFQNITREGVEGIPGIRTIFLPSPGNVIIQADFSQAELRTCAVLSGDDNLRAIYYDSSRSLHKERAAAFYGEDYTKEQYVFSKNINFGVTYGQSPAAFAQMYAKPLAEAEEYCASWWREFPQLLKWTNDVWELAKTQSYVQSPFGFKRRVNLIPQDANALKRELVNFLPQNVAAWLTFCALAELVSLGVPIINTVHDSIVADVPKEQAIFVAKTMKNVMERQPKELLGWDMPYLVDVSIGDTWGSCEEVDIAA